ncbi:MAG: type II secretion system protein [Lachnospiraceae bacterium]
MKKNNKNNKGFSLVELIIVIAIMAILIGVLAPQYLKFVEKSRQSTDKQNVDEIVRAVEIYAADPEVASADRLAASGTVTLNVGAAAGTPTGNIDKALTASGVTLPQLKSDAWGGTVVLEFTYNSTTGVVTVAIGSGSTNTTKAAEILK